MAACRVLCVSPTVFVMSLVMVDFIKVYFLHCFVQRHFSALSYESSSGWLLFLVTIMIIIKRQALDPLIRSVSRVIAARANASWSSNCSPSLRSVVVWFLRDSILWDSLQVWKPVPFLFIFCLVCLQSVVRGVCSHLFCGHKGCSLPEVSVTSLLRLFKAVRVLVKYTISNTVDVVTNEISFDIKTFLQ